MISVRPVVAVSACLLGEKVRYDGGDRRNEIILGPLAERLDYLPFCPEVGIGLPVPRPPLQLVQSVNSVRVLGVADRSLDVSKELLTYAREMAVPLSSVCGVIFKCRSPSCGLNSTPLYDMGGTVITHTSGAFAGEVARMFTDIPLVEEDELDDSQGYDEFLRRVMASYSAGL